MFVMKKKSKRIGWWKYCFKCNGGGDDWDYCHGSYYVPEEKLEYYIRNFLPFSAYGTSIIRAIKLPPKDYILRQIQNNKDEIKGFKNLNKFLESELSKYK